ncbi:MAG TPA: hypothetical protein VMV83_04190 [Rectinemataceae bacterium]|nr:hypothetical protein [Rectinemataceae bacterium]
MAVKMDGGDGLRLSNKEWMLLVECLYSGWKLRYSLAPELNEEVQDLLFKVYDAAVRNGNSEHFEFHPRPGTYYIEQQAREEYDSKIAECLEAEFRERIADLLAERDVEAAYGKDAVANMELGEYNERLLQAKDKYYDIFDEKGVDGLKIEPA